jgi:integrase
MKAKLPSHHQTRDYLRAYIVAAGITDPKAPRFQRAPRRSGALNGEGISSNAAWKIVKWRCAALGLSGKISNHSFRATGITLHQEAGGRLEDAQLLACHADTRTTRLYVRTSRKGARAEVERVQL